MKRLIFSILMLTVIALTCAWTVVSITETKDRIIADISYITVAAESGDYDETILRTNELSEYWNMERQHLIRFIRHAHIDAITLSIARINALAKYEETSELLAELSVIEWQITDIWESEKPSLKNSL